ncbi:MAG: YhdP family protein [Rhizomicrobium sp.]
MQDPIAARNTGPQANGGTLSQAWNASFIGRYVKSHHISRTAVVAAAIGVAMLFFVIGAALRLLVGPISLGPLSGQISDALAQALPGITVKYDQAAIEWSRDQGRVNLVVLGARVFDTKGRIIAQAPQADIDLAAQPFIQGKLVVTRITLVGVQLTLVRTGDGSVRLGVERDETQRDIIKRITDAINSNSTGASALQAFAIRDARVAFLDETTGMFLVAPKADVKIATSGGNLVATLAADVEVSGRAAHITGQMNLPPERGPVTGNIEVHGLDVAALGRNAKMFHFLRSIAMVADFSASFAIQGTHLLSASFGANSSGTAVLIGIKQPVIVKTLHLNARYDRASARIIVDNAILDSNQMKAHVTGESNLVYDNQGAIERLGVTVKADKVAISVPGTFAQPLAISSAVLHGSYVPATHDILVDHLGVTGVGLQLETSGLVTLIDKQSPVTELKGRIATLNVRDLMRYWPLGAADGARDWISHNIFKGSVGPILFETHFAAGLLDQDKLPDGALLMTFPIINAEANYVTGLTHLTAVQGNAKLTGNTFTVDVASARVGSLVLSKAHASVPDLSAPDTPAEIIAHLDGSMTDILKVTDLQPLHYATRFGIDPNSTKGAASVDLDFKLPLKRNLNIDSVAISVKAAVNGFGVALSKDLRLSDGSMKFEIDNNKLHASGVTSLATSRLTVDWVEDFKTRNAVTTRVAVKGMLDEAARGLLHFHANDYLSGSVGVNGTLTGHRGQLLAADMNIDLTPAVLSLDLVGISKPAGFPASAHGTATFGPHSALQTADARITGPSIQTTLSATFSPDGVMTSLNAPTVRSGSSNDFSFNLTRTAAGEDIVVKGRSVDGSRLARRGSGGGAGKNGGAGSSTGFEGPFHVSVKVDRAVLRNGIVIAPFSLDVAGVADRPATLALNGTLGKGATVSGSIVPSGNDRKLVVASSDVGLLARGLFGFGSIKGGKLDLQVTLHGPANNPPAEDSSANDFQGVMKLKDFRLLNQPFLARLFSAGSLIGFVNLLQGQGIAIDELRIPFSSHNGVLAIQDARASGPAIGISAEGWLDRPKNQVAIKGTLVPLFGINSVLGFIPLLGDLLVSKPGEGIIGMTYTVAGDPDEPRVSVNPLSMVTPGILRRIFEGKMPDAANAPSNAKPAPVTITPENPASTPPAKP